MGKAGFWSRINKKHRFLAGTIFISSVLGTAVYFLSEITNSFELFILSCFLFIVSGIVFALDVLAWRAYQDRKYEGTKNARLKTLNAFRKTLRIK